MLKLISPQEKYWQSFQQGMQEFKNHPTPYDTNGSRSGFNFTNFADYKQNCDNEEQGIGLKEGYVTSTRLWLIKDEKVIGIFDLRHRLIESLILRGGHIAYAIIPSERRKGYGYQGLKLCCQYAHNVFAIKEVLVTCNSKNTASYKTMKKVMSELGGREDTPIIVDNQEEKRVWIKTYP